ncbi:PaaI family thioesterase [Ruminococcaceae bacterium OttesenSCG-928-O06]|nr:PaaI family thioesterase [Ruminococcaceae bacterium OttesenSCG-928-O06]
MTLEEARCFFADDLFAMEQGIQIDEVDETSAACSVQLAPRHKNARGAAQGGLLYTLADFAFAVAANAGSFDTVTLNSNMHYLRAVAEGRVRAKATQTSRSRNTCVYKVQLWDDADTLVAEASITGFGRPAPGTAPDKTSDAKA